MSGLPSYLATLQSPTAAPSTPVGQMIQPLSYPPSLVIPPPQQFNLFNNQYPNSPLYHSYQPINEDPSSINAENSNSEDPVFNPSPSKKSKINEDPSGGSRRKKNKSRKSFSGGMYYPAPAPTSAPSTPIGQTIQIAANPPGAPSRLIIPNRENIIFNNFNMNTRPFSQLRRERLNMEMFLNNNNNNSNKNTIVNTNINEYKSNLNNMNLNLKKITSKNNNSNNEKNLGTKRKTRKGGKRKTYKTSKKSRKLLKRK